MVVVGLDAGNSESTLVWKSIEKTKHLTIPSWIGAGRLAELQRKRTGAGNGALDKDEFVLEHNGASYYVGDLAIEESKIATANRDNNNRYWDGHTLHMLMALAWAAGINEPIRVMTGLPVQVWSQENRRRVQGSLVGTHKFVMNGKERTLAIDAVGVMMEGASALAGYGGDDIPRGVIDIGGRTTDLFWAKGSRPVTSLCDGVALGVEAASDEIKASIYEKHQRVLKQDELRRIMRDFAAKRETTGIYNEGEVLRFNGNVTNAVQAIGEGIVQFVAKAWGDANGRVAPEASKVVLIGGGAYYFAEQLKAKIPVLEIARQPELANAAGYLSIALAATEEQWARNRG